MVNRLFEDSRVDPSANNNSALSDASRSLYDLRSYPQYVPQYKDVVARLLQDARVDPTAQYVPPHNEWN